LGVEKAIQESLARIAELKRNAPVYPFFTDAGLIHRFVEYVYEDLRERFGEHGDHLVVVMHSSGGDIHAAFNIAQLLRRYGQKELIFIIPRWAKSAATLIACAGDKILMTPVAELGPLDPQISQFNPLESRYERFSPLHIESTLELIRDEYNKGNEKLATGLLQRLQFPLTLGSFKKIA
jgi:membrane-bound ClpP family serine protease